MTKVDNLSKKKMILQEAQKMFAQYGYAATIMDDLAKRAGVNKATIYYHFKDKATLYETLFFEAVKGIADAIIVRTDLLQTPQKQLHAYVTTFSEVLDTSPHLASILLRELASGGDSMPKSVLEQLLRTTKRLASILENYTKSEGTICQDPMVIQLMIITTLSSFITTEPIRKRVHEELDPHAPTMPAITLPQLADKLTAMIRTTLTQGVNA
jgi:AcrR family transcriptional regulator